MENSETIVWLDFSFASSYISEKEKHIFIAQAKEIGRLLGYMVKNPGKFR